MKDADPAKALGHLGGTDTVLIILNRPLSNLKAFEIIWNKSLYHVCADGGANRLYDFFGGELEPRRKDFLPNAIAGDLDSLRNDVAGYYRGQAVRIIEDGNQYTTDFGKSMQVIMSYLKGGPLVKDIVIMGSLSGRVDQGIGVLHELYREGRLHNDYLFWLVSESNVSFLLQPGENHISHLQELDLDGRPIFTPNVGILPVFGPAVISTKGLEWDVTDWETEMGHKVSTSNHVSNAIITVATDRWVLFTVERHGKEDEAS